MILQKKIKMKDKITEERINKLHPKIRNEVAYLLTIAEGLISPNLAIRVVQGLRTIDEQNELFAKGRTTSGSIITNARGGSSYHNYGLAFDFAFLFYSEITKKYEYDEKKSWLVGPNHKIVTDLFIKNGYIWGGSFKKIIDSPHLEKSFGYNWRDLLKKYTDGDVILDKNGVKYVNI